MFKMHPQFSILVCLIQIYIVSLGANLILAIRNGEKGVKALEEIRLVQKQASVQIKILDVSEFSSIRNFVEEIKQEYNKIDVLINNAGVIGNKSANPVDENEAIFSTNYLGI